MVALIDQRREESLCGVLRQNQRRPEARHANPDTAQVLAAAACV
jgi:hypothetical protein